MSSIENYGRKGAIFGKIMFAIILIIVICIWLYQQNGRFLPPSH